MQRRSLGSSGFEISTIGLGTWAIGGHMWGGQDDAESIEAIHAAVDHGVNWIDTAPIYGSGHSEEVVGRAVKELPAARRPHGLHEVRPRRRQQHAHASATAREVAAECDASLRRLGVERIDLYQLHWPAPQPIAETAARVRRAAEGRQDSRDRRVELLRRAARGVARDRRAAALRSAAVQHPAARGEARRAAVVRRERRRRDLVLAALPRHAVRHLDAGQDVSRQTTAGARTRTTPARAFSGTCRRSTRSARSRRAAGSACRSSASACCCTRPASPASSSARATRARAGSSPISA